MNRVIGSNLMGKSVKSVALLVIAVLAAMMLLFTTACTSSNNDTQNQANASGSSATTSDYTFTDDLGNQISVNQPQRVIACMGSFADTWLLSGGELVAVTQDAYSGYLDASQSYPTVGDFTAPNLEEIIAQDPDFVIMTGASTGRDGAASQTELKSSLEASGITVAYFTVTTFEDYMRMLKICCDINGTEEIFEKYGNQVKADIDATISEAAAQNIESPTVMLMTTYSGGTRVQNSSTMTGLMLADLGVTNLADKNPSLLKEFSLESVIEMNPDYILVVPMGNDDAAALRNLEDATAANPAWAALDAVKNGKYVILEKDLFLYKPNEKWNEAYQDLYNIFYK